MSNKRQLNLSKVDLARAATEAQMRSLEQIDRIAQSTNAQSLFASVLLHLAYHHGEAPPSEATHGSVPAKLELLAYHLYPYFENESGSQPTTPQTLNCIKALEALFSALRILQSAGPETENELSVVAEVRRHAEVVRGSAYPEQKISQILEVQGTFENWFRRELGIGPRRAQEIIQEILWAYEQKANHILEQATEHSAAIAQAWKEAKANSPSQRSSQQTQLLAAFRKNSEAETQAFTDRLNQLVLPNLPVSPQDLVELGQPPTPEEWSALSNLVGLTIESRRSITSPVDVRRRPLFFLPDGRVLLVEVSNLLDNLWEAFESTAKKDSRFFARYVEKRTQWVETKIFKVLTTIFPPEHVYRNLAYPDIDYVEKRTAELDFAVDWGPFLVLIEAKAGQFRLEGQLHDRGRLFTDLKNNVEDAFEQARRALRYIDNESSPEFSEIKGARKLVVRKGDIRRTYILSISLHHLGTVATRLAALSELGLFRDKDYPLSISVSDLEVVATFIEGPDVFLHYIEKRLILEGVWEAPISVLKCGHGIPERPQRHGMADHRTFAAEIQAGGEATRDRSPRGGKRHLLRPA